MKKWLGRIGIVLGVLVLLLIGSWVWIWTAPPPELEVGPDTTVIEQPLRDDGTVDYIAALNQRYSEGVTPENNAFTVIARVIPPDAWYISGARQKTFDHLEATVPDEDAAYLHSFDEYAAERSAAEASEGSDEAEASERAEDTEAPAEAPSAMPWNAERPWDAERERAMEGPWSREDAPLVADWLDEQKPALDMIVEGMNRAHYWSPYVTEDDGGFVYGILRPHLQTLRRSAAALRMRAFHRLHDGDLDGAIEDVLAIKRLARHMTETPTTIEQLVGTAIASIGAEAVAVIAGQEALTAEQARALDRQLREIYRPFNLTAAIDVGERYHLLDFVQQPGHRSHVTALDGLDISGVASRVDPNRAMRRINAFYDELTEAVAAPTYAERIERLRRIEDETEQRMEDLSTPSLNWAAIAMGNRGALTNTVTDLLTGFLVPVSWRTARAMDRVEASHRLARLTLALAGYRAEHGQYPATLEDLTPDWLETVPLDLFDPDEKPMRYRVDDDRVVVYSVGFNGEDDGGEEPADYALDEGDIVFELP